MSEIVSQLQVVADRIRINSIKATNASNSGHPTSCASMADIVAVLFMDVMKYHQDDQRNPNDDRFVLSKGHAAPGLYAAWVEAGLIKEEELLNLRKITSDFEGHPTPRLPFVDVATGSLGQGLSCAAGMAYTGKYIENTDYRVYCVIGDGESAEGSIWEALSFASHYKLDNLVAVFDINRLGQSEPTAHQHEMNVYKARVEAFGWNSILIDGHDIAAIQAAFVAAETVKDKPTAIIAKTFKGAEFPNIADKDNWHGKPLGDKANDVISALEEKIKNSAVGGAGDSVTLKPKLPETSKLVSVTGKEDPIKLSSPPSYKLGDMIATRAAYGTGLVKIGDSCERVVALDADVKNSTFSIKFKEKYPNRFVECFIAEQNMVGVAIGCGTRARTIPFVSTFGAFFSRAFDQIRMGAISQTNCNFVGSHAGISIGEDGPSQMALEDLAMFRNIPGSTVFYPSDAVSTERAIELAANTSGICYIRTGRPNAPVIYNNDEEFHIGKGKVVVTSGKDQVTIVGAGVTLQNAMIAADVLREKHGIEVRVVDLFTVKPLDAELVYKCIRETSGRLVIVEDHYLDGGIGEAVLGSLGDLTELKLNVKRLGVVGVPRSGKSAELMAMFGIDANAIVKAVKSLI